MQSLRDKIAEVYLAEEKSGRKAVTLEDVPGTYESITSEWLTAVLCRQVAGAEVVSFKITDRSDGSSNRARIHLTYNEAGNSAHLPPTVFCKSSVTLKNRILLGVCSGGEGEANFFKLVRSRLNIETPMPIHAAFDPRTWAYIIVMKDIGGQADFCNEHAKIDWDRAVKLVTTLAKLHSRFYESPELHTPTLPFKPWPKFWQDNLDATAGWVESCDIAFGVCEHIIPPRLFKRRADVWPATEKSVTLHHHLPRTLIHCDVHLANWYVAANGDMGLTDWQAVSIGHWSRDYIYATGTALAIDDRRKWEKDLLRIYLEKMAELGAPKIQFDDAWLAIRQQLPTALAYWTITLRPAPGMPPMQPESISYEFIKRLTAAMDDLDSLDSFR